MHKSHKLSIILAYMSISHLSLYEYCIHICIHDCSVWEQLKLRIIRMCAHYSNHPSGQRQRLSLSSILKTILIESINNISIRAESLSFFKSFSYRKCEGDKCACGFVEMIVLLRFSDQAHSSRCHEDTRIRRTSCV